MRRVNGREAVSGLARPLRRLVAAAQRDPAALRILALASLVLLQLSVLTAGLKLVASADDDGPALAACFPRSCAARLGAHGEPAADELGTVLGRGGAQDRDRPRAADGGGTDRPPPDATAGDDDPRVEPVQQGPQDPAPGDTRSSERDGLALPEHDDLALPTREELFRAAGEATSPDLPSRRMPHARFAARAERMLALLPSLEVLHEHFPGTPMTSDVEAQLEHIRELDAAVEVSVEGFDAFSIDTSRQHAFDDAAEYHERIRPEMFIVHWTGIGYTDVDHFITSLKPYRVQFFIDHHARVHELFESDRNKPAHARSANDFSQGVEIETGPFDGSRSPLFSYTPQQIERTVYLAVEFLRRNDLPVDETTLVGHYAADLLFSNPYYDPDEGTFTLDRIRKFDPPQELMAVLVRKAQALDAALESRATAGTPDQTPDGTPDQGPDGTPDQKPDGTPDQSPDGTPDETASERANER